jgi:hypothetical protein
MRCLASKGKKALDQPKAKPKEMENIALSSQVNT